MQAPVNLADRRFLNEMLLGRLLGAGIGLQARSVFLQGLLLSNEESLPGQFKELQPLISEYSLAAKERGMSRFELALRFVIESTAVQGIVVGVNEESHVRQLISATRGHNETLSLEGLNHTDKTSIIDPRNWKS
jgi:aryl-alcohol dehydrogenase-like predicted oxidoreductase